ncbi:hypothetical protein NC796_13810 [Aliifodinibius sp. S!AR15-10]|uniref:hypothetical protein n=1 Tax=Aliifodinibius sp. S!AR15-10 TaxID=2950437 RepID=UPI0028581F43|nr:hypothetical protein [Aliifodinibius sp. S!AR15-10]MDR8392224.1 hypothetical protein [Aliifodinibius sp. S!AR15-10]
MLKRTIGVLFSLLFGLLLPEGWAQEEVIGRIQRIADISSAKPVLIDEETDRVQIQREEWINARPKIDLFRRELMQVKKNIRADLRIRLPDQKGNIFLVPNSPDTLHMIKEEGIYRITETPEKLGGFKLLVVKGSLVFDWLYGKLRVDAVGVSIDISGTSAAIVVDDSGDQGIVFLEQGTISFPEFPNIQVNSMEAFLLRRGLPPTKFDLGAQQAQQLQDFVQYNVKDVWSRFRPWWQKPKFYIPALAITVGGGIILLSGDGGGNGPASGSVIIDIPQ